MLSYLVAVAASVPALNLAERVAEKQRPAIKQLWRGVGALSLGGGIWAMHFIAMLAFEPPVPFTFEPTLTILSLVIAIVICYVVMWVIGRPELSLPLAFVASVCAGIGIAGMHYTGMAAMQSVAQQFYRGDLFVLSILIAIVASFAALLLANFFRGRSGPKVNAFKGLACVIMGGAIWSMHFTGMSALTLAVPADIEINTIIDNTAGNVSMAIAIAITTILIIAASVIAMRVVKFLEQKDQQLKQLTQHDRLTGLLNGETFASLLNERLLKSQRGAISPFTLLYVDLDNFHRVNNSLSHTAGDQVILTTKRRIRAVLSDDDLLCRLVGDEFLILKSLPFNKDTQDTARRIVEQLSAPYELDDFRIKLSASIGVAHAPQHGHDYDTLLRSAHIAMRYAKKSGGNKATLFDSSLNQELQDDIELEHDLQVAIQQQQLTPYYQPLINARTGEVVALEALARWQHPQQGFISPERFVSLAENAGFVSDLDNAIFTQACADVKQLRNMGHSRLRVSVNCSALNLTNAHLPEYIANTLKQNQLTADALTIEVTENALMSNLSLAIDLLSKIRDLGVRVSIDDFGSGYSSLAYLSKLPVDTLKVDRSFIQHIPKQKQDMAITNAIIAMAHKLDLKVVAEGVETIEQLDFLRQNDCDVLQGYYFSKPLPLHKLTQWLADYRPTNNVRSLRL
ncbi:putative bifunctional diguanylate cyclase/phosphodiesterase [Idiomarina xiamenensis]|uniref:putative bifunctional diguanylate cyclase/phosphodiesterase n=1 Tax=Idiomarina xiamenensis TaxID=1207041 RepID=UPI00192B6CD1|nr:bifunctional diguanylate cyclase/phosphodiesterase [Idiomarina xiamenensis]